MNVVFFYSIFVSNFIMIAVSLYGRRISITGLAVDVIISLALSVVGFAFYNLLGKFYIKRSAWNVMKYILIGVCVVTTSLGAIQILSGNEDLMYENAFTIGAIIAASAWKRGQAERSLPL